MLSKNTISFIRSLHQKKFREEEQLFIAEGHKLVDELLESGYAIQSVVATEKAMSDFEDRLSGRVGEVYTATEKDLERISALTTPQQVLAVAAIPRRSLKLSDLEAKLTLLLDDVRDPGNMGTILRIAHWFGVGQVICSLNSVDAHHPKVVQASMGSLFHMPVYEAGLEGLLSELKQVSKIPVYATVLGGEDMFQTKLSNEGVIIFGNESMGIRTSLQELATTCLSIPSFESTSGNRPESLNVAVSAAIVLAEFSKQRR